MKTPVAIVLSIAAGLSVVGANAQTQAVYPAQGQSAETQQQDEAECSNWAVQTSGFDPAQTAPAPVAAAPVTGSGARAAGAVGGAAIAGIAGGNAGTGALAGAAAGGLTRRVQTQNAANQQNQANAQQQQAGMDAFARARAACLTGRGYSVQ